MMRQRAGEISSMERYEAAGEALAQDENAGRTG